MQQYDGYLFDWDGTLAKSHELWLTIMHGQLRRHNLHLPDEQVVKQLFGRYDEGLRELGFSAPEIAALSEELIATAKRQFPLVDLYPEAHTVLDTLRRLGKKIGLVTGSYRDVISVAVTNHNLLQVFDVIVTGDEVKAQKPDPSGLFTALEKMQVVPSRAIMIGDSPKDLLAGRNAGMHTMLFYPPDHELEHSLTELQDAQPTFTIRSWQELLDQLQ